MHLYCILIKVPVKYKSMLTKIRNKQAHYNAFLICKSCSFLNQNQLADFTWLLIWISKAISGKRYNEKKRLIPLYNSD